MEMHQVRYFLATAAELNFTKAAERCNVSQPSLTRAIKQLEGELGGDLFRRERPASQLTELGQRMLPLLKQCYDAAVERHFLLGAKLVRGAYMEKERSRAAEKGSPPVQERWPWMPTMYTGCPGPLHCLKKTEKRRAPRFLFRSVEARHRIR